MPTAQLAVRTRVWCDHGAAHPWVASHTDEHGQIIDVIGRADTRQAAKELTATGSSHAPLAWPGDIPERPRSTPTTTAKVDAR